MTAQAKQTAAWPDGNDGSVGSPTSGRGSPGGRCGRRRSTASLSPGDDQVRDEPRAEREQEHLRPPERQSGDERDREEDQAEGTDLRQPDEDLIEPAHPVLDHPALQPMVEADHAAPFRLRLSSDASQPVPLTVTVTVSCTGASGRGLSVR